MNHSNRYGTGLHKAVALTRVRPQSKELKGEDTNKKGKKAEKKHILNAREGSFCFLLFHLLALCLLSQGCVPLLPLVLQEYKIQYHVII